MPGSRYTQPVKPLLLGALWLLITTPLAAEDTAIQSGQARVTMGDRVFEFVVIQCVHDQPAAYGDAVIEMQLDGVPRATPQATIERLKGLVDAEAQIAKELAPVVEYGPLLSITRVKDGGEMLAVTDMGQISLVSDGSLMEANSRRLDIDISAGRVSGTTVVAGQTVTVDAACPD